MPLPLEACCCPCLALRRAVVDWKFTSTANPGEVMTDMPYPIYPEGMLTAIDGVRDARCQTNPDTLTGPSGELTAAGVWWWHAVRLDKTRTRTANFQTSLLEEPGHSIVSMLHASRMAAACLNKVLPCQEHRSLALVEQVGRHSGETTTQRRERIARCEQAL